MGYSEKRGASEYKLLLGSARVSRVGERVFAIANFLMSSYHWSNEDWKGKVVSARRRNQHARRVRYSGLCLRGFFDGCADFVAPFCPGTIVIADIVQA
jgi:hypothetical protein